MFGVKFAKYQPGDYVFKYKNGRVVKEGKGLSFYYYVPTTSIVLVPTGSVDIPFIFDEATVDFQSVSIQGQITYRIVDANKISQLLNFTLDHKTQHYVSEDPVNLSQRVVNIARVLTKKQLSNASLRDALKSSEMFTKSIYHDIQSNAEIQSLGLEILGLSILAILPKPETSRALEAETREKILKEADDAIYLRRNSSVEQERKIKENELNTEIAVENKKKQIKEAQMESEKLMQQKNHELKTTEMNFNINQEEKKKKLVDIAVENARTQADAKAYEIKAVMQALEGVNPLLFQVLAGMGMQPDKLIALAFQELAGKAEKIGQLNISPDLLQELLKQKK